MISLLLIVPISGAVPPRPLRDLAASVLHPSLDLVLEVARSSVDGAGRGLFVRTASDDSTLTVAGGTSLCGYGDGQMCASRPPRARGRFTEFKLVGCAPVWFDGELVSACELLQRDLIDGIAGHEAVRNTNGDLVSLRAIDAYDGSKFFVPSEAAIEGADLTNVDSLGIMANDLAAHVPLGEYDAKAAAANVLVLVQGLVVDPQRPTWLAPSRPVPTLCRTTTFDAVPREVGISYGAAYWHARE